MRKNLERVFGIDIRALAAFRVAVALIILVDLALRCFDFTAHYTEDGIAPLSATWRHLGTNSFRWTLYSLSDSSLWSAGLMGTTAIAAGCLLIGWRTWYANLACWVLMTSLHFRNPFVINAGDSLLRILLFWGLFLPLGRVWSRDAQRAKQRHSHDMFGHDKGMGLCDLATAAILIQMAVVYVTTGLYKWQSGWMSENDLAFVMAFDAYAKPAASWASQFPQVLAWMTRSTVLLEVFGPLVAFLPWKTSMWRMLVVLAFGLFHLGIELTMTVGLFSYVSMAGWLLFLPTSFWNRLFPQSQAVAVGDASKSESALNRSNRWIHGTKQTIAGVLCIAVIVWVTGDLVTGRKAKRPIWAKAGIEGVSLRQRWSMFARAPRRDGWYVVAAQTSDGSRIDLLRDGAAVSWDRPPLISAQWPNHRWRKYASLLSRPQFDHLRPVFVQYLADQPRFHSQELETVELHFVEEKSKSLDEPPRIAHKLLYRERLNDQGEFAAALERHDAERPAEIHPGL